ncbi:MAG: 50S ribosomal subunit protein L10 [Candidatus Westeberhardia cardiocondylae]|nr:50S ribosomal subunit protein L10 [Candidatus Westeberhardia cardiocondylae]
MLSSRKKKEIIVSEMKNMAISSVSVIIANFSGVTVDGMNKLRKIVRSIPEVYIKVVRNTLIRRFIENTNFSCLNDFISGQIIVGFSFNNPSEIVRVFLEYSYIDEKFKILAASFENKIILPDKIPMLANLPTYKDGVSLLLLIIKKAIFDKIIRIFLVLCKDKMSS